MDDKIKLFYSYSHQDEKVREKLEMHLAVLKRANIIEEWHDRKISPGSNWESDINENLVSSDIVLLLVSSSFLASDYCIDIETASALDLHQNGDLRVIPIIIHPCYWEITRFANEYKLQALPKNAQAISTFINQDEAWVQVVKGIHKVADEIKKKKTIAVKHQEEEKDVFNNNSNGIKENEYLVKQFLKTYSKWYFSPLRIVKWGGRKKGFSDLSKLSSNEVSSILTNMEKQNIVKSIISQKGNPIYKLK